MTNENLLFTQKLELKTKENHDNETVLDKLLTDFKELQTALN